MKKVIAFLQENPVQYLATIGRDGKAKCRPFMFAGEMDGKLWFCTNSTKDVYKDMQVNPYVELSVSSPSYAWIRLSGKAVFENNHGGEGNVHGKSHRQGPVRRRVQSDFRSLLFGRSPCSHRRFFRQSASGIFSVRDGGMRYLCLIKYNTLL